MNLRQKAKRYKKLYESTKYNKVPYNVITIHDLQHYRVSYSVNRRCYILFDHDHNKELSIACDNLLDKMKEKLIDNIEYRNGEDCYDTYSLDFWLKR